MSVALVRIQLRSDTAVAWSIANPLLRQGEPGVERDTARMKVGDGVKLWRDLPYVGETLNSGAGDVDGGDYVGLPVVDATPPPQDIVPLIGTGGSVAVSWSPVTPFDPADYTLYYSLFVREELSDTFREVSQSNLPSEPAVSRAICPASELADGQRYFFRVLPITGKGRQGAPGDTRTAYLYTAPPPIPPADEPNGKRG